MRDNAWVKWSVTGLRLFLGIIFFTAGMSKLTQAFPGVIGPVWLEEKLEPYGLGMYVRFIAWSQVVIGLLLLSQRFATLGAVMLMPMILNIWVVTISLAWRGTPTVNFVLLIMNLVLLLWDYHKLKFLISDHPEEIFSHKLMRVNWKMDVLWLVATALILASVPVIPTHHAVGYFMVILGLLLFIYCHFASKLKLKARS